MTKKKLGWRECAFAYRLIAGVCSLTGPADTNIDISGFVAGFLDRVGLKKLYCEIARLLMS